MRVYVILLSFLLAVPAFASELSAPDGVHRLFQSLEITPAMRALPKESPDFPIVVVAEAMKAAQNGDPNAVVQLLEPLLTQVQFEPQSSIGEGQSTQLIVGNVGSFGLWREMAYLTAGQAYYKLDRDDEAIRYLSGIPDRLFIIRLGEHRDRLGGAEKARQGRRRHRDPQNRGTSRPARARAACRAQADRRVLRPGNGRLRAGCLSGEAVDLGQNASPNLVAIKIKLLAQSNLSIYLKKTNALSFDEKRELIAKIVGDLDHVPVAYRDPAFSFLASETYWHLASVLRIEDPDKFKSEISVALKHADEWIAPWVDRSLKEKRPLISEDALFLSVTTLWEQRRFNDALPRLLALPVFFPKGQFLQDTYQLLADYYFDSGEFAQAARYYALLAQVGNEEKASYGVYKAAWTFYNQDQKWKALRHLERLLLHYRAELGGEAEKDIGPANGTLVKEAQGDMLLIMAELLPYRTAFREIEIFGYSKERKLEVRERLAKVYQDIGKYEDSVSVLTALLDEYGQSAPAADAFKWLEQLTYVLLSSGKRDAIATAIDHFVPRMPKADSDETRKLHDKMEKQIVTVALTVHREAKKTDDPDIWRATDAIYRSFARNFPDSTEADIWYYGAQRKEQLNQRLEAMHWYEKASVSASYANRADAALNVLRLARELSTDKDFLTQQKDLPGFYARLAKAAETYIASFRDTKERPLAEILLLDFYCRANEAPKADQYLTDVIRAEGATASHQEQYLAQNHRLYDAGKWEEAYQLATNVEHVLSETPGATGFVGKVRSFAQETAFQVGVRPGTSEGQDPSRAIGTRRRSRPPPIR